MFSSQSEIALEDLQMLSFVVTFANQTSLVLRKEDDEEVWRCAKERFKRLFLRTRSFQTYERDFEIWIEVGDTVASSIAVLDDDNWPFLRPTLAWIDGITFHEVVFGDDGNVRDLQA
ncbi:hypothetical protein VTL71DRAFT_6024 [Oculimacula yallundae]|uniref:Uncharacterized protein n=1 Tax=Oculimacula yallundae TaxID=86028 RepID=A0ABR4BZV2_9HELO